MRKKDSIYKLPSGCARCIADAKKCVVMTTIVTVSVMLQFPVGEHEVFVGFFLHEEGV